MPPRDWSVFERFSDVHLATVLTCALLIAGLAWLGRRLGGTHGETVLRRTLAFATLGFCVLSSVYWNWAKIDVYGGLPLHICDLGGIIGPLALLTGNRWLRATLYFWVVTLTLQAFVQPELAEGPATLRFWTFWLSHSSLAACAVYDLSVLRFRPDWSDLGRASVASLAYVALIIPINLSIEANYGFVGNPPPYRSLPPMIAALGPWPERVVVIMVLAILGFALALLPWRLRRRTPADAGSEEAAARGQP